MDLQLMANYWTTSDADDTPIFEGNVAGLQPLMNQMNTVGLKMNTVKTNVMVFRKILNINLQICIKQIVLEI